jgi:hypothetical protein
MLTLAPIWASDDTMADGCMDMLCSEEFNW